MSGLGLRRACAVLLLGAGAACVMPSTAPKIPRSDIADRNEIQRAWRAFSEGASRGDVDAAWYRLSRRYREEVFVSSPEAWAQWTAREREGLLAGIDGSWLHDLRLRAIHADAAPEPMRGLARVHFTLEEGAWRIDRLDPFPAP